MLAPCTEASLSTMIVAISSTSKVAWVKSQHCLYSLSKFSSLVDFCFGTLILISFSFGMFYMISFTMVSIDFTFSAVLSLYFLSCTFHLSSPKKHLMLLILKHMSSPDLICCETWNDKVPVENVLLLLLLMHSFCWLLMPLYLCHANNVPRDMLLTMFVYFLHVFWK